jgi:hypothetical protein
MRETASFQGLRASEAEQTRAERRLKLDEDTQTEIKTDRLRKRTFEDQAAREGAQDREYMLDERNRKLQQEGFIDLVKAAVEGRPKESVLKNPRVAGGQMPIKDYERTPDGGIRIVNATGEEATIDSDMVQDLYRSAYGLPAVNRRTSIGQYGTFKGLQALGDAFDLTETDEEGNPTFTPQHRAAFADAWKQGISLGDAAAELGLKPRGAADLDKAAQEYKAAQQALADARRKATTDGWFSKPTVGGRERRKLESLQDAVETKKGVFMGLKAEMERRLASAVDLTAKGIRGTGQPKQADPADQQPPEVVMSDSSQAGAGADRNGDGRVDETERLYSLAKTVTEVYDAGDPKAVSAIQGRYGDAQLARFRAIVKSMEKKIQTEADGLVGAGR